MKYEKITRKPSSKIFVMKKTMPVTIGSGNVIKPREKVRETKGNKSELLSLVKSIYNGDKAYIKFYTKGKGDKFKCITQVCDSSKNNVHYSKYMWTRDNNVQGEGEVICRWDDIYWGVHGSAEYIALMRNSCFQT